MKRRQTWFRAAVVWLACVGAGMAAEPIRIALMVPLSGPFANIGELYRTSAQFAVDELNARAQAVGGRGLELLPFDNKNSPQESIQLLGHIAELRVPFLIQTGGSHVAVPLSEAVARHNERDPTHRLLLLNPSGDQDLTQEKCSFWTFMFMANAEIKLDALTTYIARQSAVRRVYLINQDYSFGHQFRRFAREMLLRKRPDIQIVGDDLHPIGKVKDFAPYVAKIRAARADAIVTGNWGPDITLLVKAATEMGLKSAFYTFYGLGPGAATAMGPAAIDRVHILWRWDWDMRVETMRRTAGAYKNRFGLEYYATPMANLMAMLSMAVQRARSTDAVAVAYALEDLRIAGDLGEAWMRPDDHQLFERLRVLAAAKLDGHEVNYAIEGAGFGLRTEALVEVRDQVRPTQCRMARPPRPH